MFMLLYLCCLTEFLIPANLVNCQKMLADWKLIVNQIVHGKTEINFVRIHSTRTILSCLHIFMNHNIILDEFLKIKKQMKYICMSMLCKFMTLDMRISHIILDVLTNWHIFVLHICPVIPLSCATVF
jgi:hypothetical protein